MAPDEDDQALDWIPGPAGAAPAARAGEAPSTQEPPWAPPPAWIRQDPSLQDPAWAQPEPGAQDAPWAPAAPPPARPSEAVDPGWDQTSSLFGPPPRAAGPMPGYQPWSAADPVFLPDLHPGPGDPADSGAADPGTALPSWMRRALGRRKKAWLAAAAAVVAAALITGIVVLITHHSGGPAASGRLGARGRTSPSLGRTAGERTPITVAGVFPQSETVEGVPFTRVASALDKDCSATANGAFATALTSAGCRRVVRATFVDSPKRYAVTVGVAALPSSAAAAAVNAAKQFGPDVWFTGLDGPSGSGASAVTKSVGVGYELVYRRFIVYALATYADGHSPAGNAAEIQALTSLDRSFVALVLQPTTPGPNG